MSDKVTIYFQGGYGMAKIEGRLIEHGTRKHAQYNNAPFVRFVPKRARSTRSLQQSSNPYILVIEGWGHPDLDNWKPAVEQGPVTVTEGKYRSCDPRWNTDADTVLDAYVAETGTPVVADYRHTKGFSPYGPK